MSRDPEEVEHLSNNDRRLTGSQAAKLAGVQPGTWRSYTTPKGSRGGKLHGPPPDGHCDPCGCPWWWESTVKKWIENRPSTTPKT